MPGVTGLEILQEVRADPALTDLPVIILTARTEPETKYQALLKGATNFLNKPVDFTELFAQVRNALTVKAHQDELKRYAQELDRRVQERTAELAMSRLEVIQCLARAAECRTDLTKQHSIRASGYAGAIARGLGLDELTVETIELASLVARRGQDRILGFRPEPCRCAFPRKSLISCKSTVSPLCTAPRRCRRRKLRRSNRTPLPDRGSWRRANRASSKWPPSSR